MVFGGVKSRGRWTKRSNHHTQVHTCVDAPDAFTRGSALMYERHRLWRGAFADVVGGQKTLGAYQCKELPSPRASRQITPDNEYSRSPLILQTDLSSRRYV